jgi:hypothetical protein
MRVMRVLREKTSVGLVALVLLLVALLLPTVHAFALEAVLTDDASTSSISPQARKRNFGDVAGLLVSPSARAFLKFDLSTLPANAEVQKATLTIYLNAVATAGSFDVRRPTQDWNELTLTNNNAPSLVDAGLPSIPIGLGDRNNFVSVDSRRSSRTE